MSRVVSAVAAAAVLAGPTAIAFFSGGYFDQPRLIAGIGASALVLVAALAARRPLPCGGPARLAIASLAGLSLWSALSLIWAPLGGPALDDVQRLALYALALTAATAWLRSRRAVAAVEPALALGALTVVVYALSERMFPALLEFERSGGAAGRLEQPLTYWNAMGALAMLGLVLAIRLAGSSGRPSALRAAAAAAVPTLMAGLYLTFSRGALAALAVGALALVALAADRSQLRAAAVGAVIAALAVALTAVLPEVRTLNGGAGQGALLLAGLLALGAASGGAQLLLVRGEARGRLQVGPQNRRLVAALATGLSVIVVLAAVLTLGSSGDGRRGASPEAGAERLRTLETNRYGYWSAAIESFADHPVRGVGSSGFRAEWQRERGLRINASDAHSLYIETAAELGVVGLLLVGGLFAGVALSARRAMAVRPALATGPAAALVAWSFHAGLDWDWEMPAVTLPALALAALLLAVADEARA